MVDVLEKSEVERVQTEKNPSLLDENYQRLFDLLPIGVTILDMKGVFLYCNPSVYSKGGYNEGEFTGKHFSKIASVRLKDIPTFIRVFNSIVKGKIPQPFEAIYQRKDGTTAWTNLSISLIKVGGKRRILVLQHDITERKRAEEEMKRARDDYLAITNLTGDIIVQLDKQGRWTFLNSRACEFFGKPREELLGLKFANYLHPDDLEETRVATEEVASGKTVTNLINRQKTPTGFRTVQWNGAPIIEQGEYVGFQATGRDITQQREAEQALRNLSQFRESIIDNTNVWLNVLDQKANIILWNKAAERISGYSQEEAVGHDKIWEWLYPDEAYRNELTEQVAAILGKGATDEDLETTIRCKDGQQRIISWNQRNLLDEGGEFIGSIALGHDITERSRAQQAETTLQAQLYQAQKLESIGTLASGIAHEINNPLMGMINYAQLIHDRIKDDKLKEFSDGIIKEGNRVATIVKNLLSFALQEEETHTPAYISDIIEASLLLIGAVLRKDQIMVELDIPEDLPKIKCRSQQIEQVILNLLTNARDALNRRYEGYHEDKVLKISVWPFEKEGEKWIRTTVEDHGIGVPQDVSNRVFDPFYSTKPKEKGTGLGLSVSHGIVKEHRGELTVESKPGDYTRFYMDLRVDNQWSAKSGTGGVSPDDSPQQDDICNG